MGVGGRVGSRLADTSTGSGNTSTSVRVRTIECTVVCTSVSASVSASVVTVDTFSLSQGGSTSGAIASKSTTNRLWLALESISALLTSSEGASLGSELAHADSGESSGSVVLSLVLMNLVDWDGGVDNGWLDSLLLDDWLNGLMDVVVNMLTSNGGAFGCSMLGLSDSSGVLELGLFSSETFLNLIVISVLNVAVLNSSELMSVLLWKDFAILDRLD